MIRVALAGCALMLVAHSFPAMAQDSAACSQIRVAAERLACYDRLHPPVSGAETLRSEAERREQAKRDFGLNSSQRVAQGSETAAPAVGRVQGKIESVTRLASGQRRVVLEDGQVWLLTEATMAGPLDTGDIVQFRKASMGTFMLLTPRGVALRAKRLN